jgi:hypothetical protein
MIGLGNDCTKGGNEIDQSSVACSSSLNKVNWGQSNICERKRFSKLGEMAR